LGKVVTFSGGHSFELSHVTTRKQQLYPTMLQ